MMPGGFPLPGSNEYAEYALQCWYQDLYPFGKVFPQREPEPVIFLSDYERFED
jgi:hypothetical protein